MARVALAKATFVYILMHWVGFFEPTASHAIFNSRENREGGWSV